MSDNHIYMAEHPNLFVFTASNKAAQQHLLDTIVNPAPAETIKKYLTTEELNTLDELTDGRYYCWGATPGEKNAPTWKKMKSGDDVLAYYNKEYHYHAKVVWRTRNKELAKALWGSLDNGSTWEYIYFLTEPLRISPPISSESTRNIIQSQFQGFSKVRDDKAAALNQKYGNVSGFIRAVHSDRSIPVLIDVIVNALRSKQVQALLTEPEFHLKRAQEKLKEFEAIQGDPSHFQALAARYQTPEGKPFLEILQEFTPGTPDHTTMKLVAGRKSSTAIPTTVSWRVPAFAKRNG